MKKPAELLEKYSLKNKIVIGYIGTHGLAHSLDTIILSAEILMKKGFQESIHFLFIGNGAKKSELISLYLGKGIACLSLKPKASNLLSLDKIPPHPIFSPKSLAIERIYVPEEQ